MIRECNRGGKDVPSQWHRGHYWGWGAHRDIVTKDKKKAVGLQ